MAPRLHIDFETRSCADLKKVAGAGEFLDAVQPQLIVATSGDFPQRERISDDWAERVRTRGIKLFRQDETGAIQLEFDKANGWLARAYMTGETFRSTSR